MHKIDLYEYEVGVVSQSQSKTCSKRETKIISYYHLCDCAPKHIRVASKRCLPAQKIANGWALGCGAFATNMHVGIQYRAKAYKKV